MEMLKYFKALSDLTRLRLVNVLLHHELSVNELVTLTAMGQSRISRHLKILMDSEILDCRRDGVWAFYSVSRHSDGRKFIDAVKYLFEEKAPLTQDLLTARRLIEDRKVKTMQFFNTIAQNWDHLKQDILGRFDLNAAILNHMPSCSTAVDLGCGTGELLIHMTSAASHIIGVDSSAKMIDQARQRFINTPISPDLRLGELEHLPLSDSEADCAVISMVLHHMSNPVAAMLEINRILKPGGALIIADFEKHTNETMRNTYGDRWLGFHRHEISDFLDASGFSLTHAQTYPLHQNLTLNIFYAEKLMHNKGETHEYTSNKRFS